LRAGIEWGGADRQRRLGQPLLFVAADAPIIRWCVAGVK